MLVFLIILPIHIYAVGELNGPSLALPLLFLEIFDDVAGNELEGFVDVETAFGACFEKLHSVLLRHGFSHFLCDHLFVFHVGFVAQKYYFDVVCRMAPHLADPIGDIIERLLVCGIVSHYHTLSAPVISLCYGSKSFLSCGIPDLNFDRFSVQIYGSYFKVNTNSRNMRILKIFFAKSKQQTSLTDSGVTDDDEL